MKFMAKQPKKSGTEWTPQDDKQLTKLIKENTPTRLIALKMTRTPAAIYNHAAEKGKSLKPTNQRPYNRIKK